MGCHTWCYKKSEKFEKREAIGSILFWIKNDISFIEKELIDNAADLGLKRELRNKRRLLTLVEKEKIYADNTIEKLYNRYKEDGGPYFNGARYEECGYHNIFRIGNYPEDVLTSLEETQKFINENKNCYDIDTLRILEFWKTYPDGIIDFG